jgi:hypothetical protein
VCPSGTSASARACGWRRDHSAALRRDAVLRGIGSSGRIGICCGAPCTRRRADADARVLHSALLVAGPLAAAVIASLTGMAGSNTWDVFGFLLVLGAIGALSIAALFSVMRMSRACVRAARGVAVSRSGPDHELHCTCGRLVVATGAGAPHLERGSSDEDEDKADVERAAAIAAARRADDEDTPQRCGPRVIRAVDALAARVNRMHPTLRQRRRAAAYVWRPLAVWALAGAAIALFLLPTHRLTALAIGFCVAAA